ncbi:MAG: hypothetical protein EPO40_00380 [Myxococcaceae bacterium]|nr:MAG: hypothetical protein EPO40_00380 [Myxococcaceae bacterium]
MVLEIRDSTNGILSFDLRDVLLVVGSVRTDLWWRLSGVDAYGEGGRRLNDASDNADVLSNAQLVDIAVRVDQVIDGVFCGYTDINERPWAVIRAIDSTFWEVECDDERLAQSLLRRFSAVTVRDE